jgi:hypothetical protein
MQSWQAPNFCHRPLGRPAVEVRGSATWRGTNETKRCGKTLPHSTSWAGLWEEPGHTPVCLHCDRKQRPAMATGTALDTHTHTHTHTRTHNVTTLYRHTSLYALSISTFSHVHGFILLRPWQGTSRLWSALSTASKTFRFNIEMAIVTRFQFHTFSYSTVLGQSLVKLLLKKILEIRHRVHKSLLLNNTLSRLKAANNLFEAATELFSHYDVTSCSVLQHDCLPNICIGLTN